MERKEIEDRIKKIIPYTKNEKLWNLLKKSISSFSEADLQKVLNFLETWDKSMLLRFIQEKTKDAMWEMQVVKLAKWKIIIWKNIRIEKKEKAEELIEAEKLLDQL